MLRLSLERSGFVGGGDHQKFDLARELDTIKAWKDVWAGGHGVSDVTESAPRSEEHTSELQSLMRISYAVFCLKKKNYLLFLLRCFYCCICRGFYDNCLIR